MKTGDSTPPKRLKVRLTPAAEKEVRRGHPWVFRGSIKEASREAQTGELAVIYDHKDEFLAVGLFDSVSPIAIRILHHGKPLRIDEAFFQARLNEALKKREGLLRPGNTGLRLVNGESDGFPGLVIDRYESTIVLKLYTASWIPSWDLLSSVLKSIFAEDTLVLRFSRNCAEAWSSGPGLRDGNVIQGQLPSARVPFRENGIWFYADVLKGQKTGFFLDQRDNRERVRSHCAGRSVLNLFAYTGGFSLYAAAGGASSVTSIDISEHALEELRANLELNRGNGGHRACEHNLVRADVFEWLKGNNMGKYDVVIVDPPSLAKRESDRAGAILAYEKVVAAAFAKVAKGGLLVAASCSAHVSAGEFFEAALRAVSRAGGRTEELGKFGHAADHAASFKEAEYLKSLFLRCK